MSTLARQALETLQDQANSPGLRSVAATTLLVAFAESVEVPVGSQVAVWRYLLASDASTASLHRYEIAHPDVAADGVRVLLDRDSGENARDLASAVLRSENVTAITDDAITTIVDRVLDEGKARQVAWLVERVHEQRGLTPEFLRALRDRIARSASPAVRVAAVEIGGLLPNIDEAFTRSMLSDSAPPVRAAVVEQLAAVDEPDQSRAETIVRQHLVVERHRTVLSASHYALGALVAGRRR